MTYCDAQAHNTCPCCGHPEEDTLHILRCTNRVARSLWHNQVTSLMDWCVKVDTQDALVSTLTEVLLDWPTGSLSNHNIRQDWPVEIRQAQREQALLGWQAFFVGIWTTSWATLQQEYYDLKGLRRTGSKWAKKQ